MGPTLLLDDKNRCSRIVLTKWCPFEDFPLEHEWQHTGLGPDISCGKKGWDLIIYNWSWNSSPMDLLILGAIWLCGQIGLLVSPLITKLKVGLKAPISPYRAYILGKSIQQVSSAELLKPPVSSCDVQILQNDQRIMSYLIYILHFLCLRSVSSQVLGVPLLYLGIMG